MSTTARGANVSAREFNSTGKDEINQTVEKWIQTRLKKRSLRFDPYSNFIPLGGSIATGAKDEGTLYNFTPKVYRNLLGVLRDVSRQFSSLRHALDDLSRFMSSLDLISSLVESQSYRRHLLRIPVELKMNSSEHRRLDDALRKDEEAVARLLNSAIGSEWNEFKGALLGGRRRAELRRFDTRCSGQVQPAAQDVLPSSLFIKGVRRQDIDAFFGGSFGDIYRATYGNLEVAIKRIRMFQDTVEQERRKLFRSICREALLWRTLRHPFILPFFGVDEDNFPGSFCLVSPWMANGTILKHLGENSGQDVDLRLFEIAQGLAYLHSQHIVHGDLRGSNILVDLGCHACIADFGLSVFSDATVNSSHRAGSVRWMAPELLLPDNSGLEHSQRTFMGDVYSFACVCIELYTRKPPFVEISREPAVLFSVIKGERPTRPPKIEEWLWNVVELCWKQDRVQRPSVSRVVEMMQIGSPGGELVPLMPPLEEAHDEDITLLIEEYATDDQSLVQRFEDFHATMANDQNCDRPCGSSWMALTDADNRALHVKSTTRPLSPARKIFMSSSGPIQRSQSALGDATSTIRGSADGGYDADSERRDEDRETIRASSHHFSGACAPGSSVPPLFSPLATRRRSQSQSSRPNSPPLFVPSTLVDRYDNPHPVLPPPPPLLSNKTYSEGRSNLTHAHTNDTPSVVAPLRLRPKRGKGSITKQNPNLGRATGPEPEDMYERLEDFFPHHDLDKPVIETPTSKTIPTSAMGFGVPSVANIAVPEEKVKVRRGKKGIRIVAEEHKKRIDRTSRIGAALSIPPATGPSTPVSAVGGRVVDVLRKRSTKLWGSKLEEVTPSQAQAPVKASPSHSYAPPPPPPSTTGRDHPESSPGGPTTFKWVRGEMIGKGSYGKVFLALNATTGEMMAVKQVELPRTPSDRNDSRQITVVQALKLEIETLKDLDHPNIVQYLGFEETPSNLSIFLEYVPGGSIGSVLLKHGKLSEVNTKSFTGQILNGLEYLHSKGILHRDLRTDNILVEASGICKIFDFAVSKWTEDFPAATLLQGTVFWMAPEVVNLQGTQYSVKVDIWSVGCMVLEMLAGTQPWTGDEMLAVMFKLYQEKVPPPVPEGVVLSEAGDDFRKKCFAINPDERPSAAVLRTHDWLKLPDGWQFTGFT
uniref:Putative kinase-like protein n=1 Tax=Moniliophthora roreri TaxID=221103 RepID=A0A0W0FGM3_MONRR